MIENMVADNGESRRQTVKKLATFCIVLLLVVITASAYLRLAGAGLGCDDWPACYGHSTNKVVNHSAANSPAFAVGVIVSNPARNTENNAKPQHTSPHADGIAKVRIVHRIAATVALLLVIAMTWLCWRRKPTLQPEGIWVLSLLVLMLILSVLGWFTGTSTLPAVVLVNLLGGFSMLPLAWLVRVSAMGSTSAKSNPIQPASQDTSLLIWARFGAVLLLAEIVLGGLISADFAAAACSTLFSCEGQWWPKGDWFYVFNVMHDFALTPLDKGDSGAAALHLLHRGVAVGVAVVLGTAALRAASKVGVVGIVIPALILGEILLGFASVSGGLPLVLVIAHNFLAALLLAATVDFLYKLKKMS